MSPEAARIVFGFAGLTPTPAITELGRQYTSDEIGIFEFLSEAKKFLDHKSDCSLHNGPAEKPINCDCGVAPDMTPERYGSEFPTS